MIREAVPTVNQCKHQILNLIQLILHILHVVLIFTLQKKKMEACMYHIKTDDNYPFCLNENACK